MTYNEIYQSLKPLKSQRIYDLAIEAGLSGNAWEFSRKTGLAIEPSDNIYQNSLWNFGGGTEPYLACLWWKNLTITPRTISSVGNFRVEGEKWANLKTDMKVTGEKEYRLTMKIKKAQAFSALVSTAKLRRKPIRVILLDGDTPPSEDAAYESAKASRRLLDGASWWVHSFDVNGSYEIVRDVEPPLNVAIDPFNDACELGTETDFIDWLDNSPLSDTEKDALVKVRVGQGYFRDALVKRWEGCAVTSCRDMSLLIASHIKPWKECTTRAERLSPDNGILLSPNIDKAFDRGLVSFDDSFKMIFHTDLHLHTKNTLPINQGLALTNRSHAGMRPFLRWHRQNFDFEAKST